MTYVRLAANLAAWVLGLLFALIGLINVGWGNDQVYGLFIMSLAAVFFPPVRQQIFIRTGKRVPVWLLVVTGLFIVWSSVGVGELFDKVDLIMAALRG
jgi:hypothetical protein